MGNHIFLTSAEFAVSRPAIYFIFSKVHRYLYIGQTYDKGGVLSRLRHHLCDEDNSSFLRRLEEDIGEPRDSLRDLYVACYFLKGKQFWSYETSYREGVEFCVQKLVYERQAGFSQCFKVISFVRTNKTSDFAFVQNEALQAVRVFQDVLERIPK